MTVPDLVKKLTDLKEDAHDQSIIYKHSGNPAASDYYYGAATAYEIAAATVRLFGSNLVEKSNGD